MTFIWLRIVCTQGVNVVFNLAAGSCSFLISAYRFTIDSWYCSSDKDFSMASKGSVIAVLSGRGSLKGTIEEDSAPESMTPPEEEDPAPEAMTAPKKESNSTNPQEGIKLRETAALPQGVKLHQREQNSASSNPPESRVELRLQKRFEPKRLRGNNLCYNNYIVIVILSAHARLSASSSSSSSETQL